MGNGRLRKVFIALLALSVFAGQGCTKGVSPATQQASRPVTLNVWGVVDDVDAYQEIFQDYRTLHPNVTVQYRRLRLEEYEPELVNAFAEDRGPDVFLIHNTWVGKYLPKIAPMPPETSVVVRRITGTIKKTEVYQVETNKSITLRQYKNDFADVVSADTIRTVNVSSDPDKPQKEDRIVALPLSVDTLGMFVNKDILNASGVAVTPSSWTQIQEVVPKLVKLDTLGQFIQYGASLGTAYNIDRSSDIVTALMMQNGAQMSLADGTPSFQAIPQDLRDSRSEPPAYQAITFYTDFANPNKEVYTWNADQPDSLEAFIEGRIAFFFGYSYHVPTILARAPKMNLGIASLPQIEGNRVMNVANYWAWTVSKKSKNTGTAWNLLNFMAGQDEMQKYVDKVKRPASRKAILPSQYEDEDVGVFASQVLTAQTWYRGDDPIVTEQALEAMIDSVQRGTEEIQTAVRTAQQKIGQTITY